MPARAVGLGSPTSCRHVEKLISRISDGLGWWAGSTMPAASYAAFVDGKHMPRIDINSASVNGLPMK